jgi:hypothetical protein
MCAIRPILIILLVFLGLAPFQAQWLDGRPGIAAAAPMDQDGNEEDVPDEVLDDLALLLNWAGGGASGVIGRGCGVTSDAGYEAPCEVSQNQIMRVNRDAALEARGWASQPRPTFSLRLADGRELTPVHDEADVVFWWIPLDASLGNAVLLMRQGTNVAEFPAKVTARTGEPLVAAGWGREGPDAPTELLPTGRAGARLNIRMTGFPANQDVALLLFRLVESNALGAFALFDRPLVSVNSDEHGNATYVWDTDRDQTPGSYAIYTVPDSATNWLFSDQGIQLCIAPRNGPDECASPATAVGPRELMEPLVAQSVAHAAQTWVRLGRDATRPISDLECAYSGAALSARRQQLQNLRALGDVLDARLTRKVQVQSMSEAQPDAFKSGLLAIVEERWGGKIRHSNGSDEDIEPKRQIWRYVLQRSEGGLESSDDPACGKGLIISEATLQP